MQSLLVGDDVQQDVNPGVDLVELNAMEENGAPHYQNKITSGDRFLAIALRLASHFAYLNTEK